jgi:pilus assembly protein Flp/PilA
MFYVLNMIAALHNRVETAKDRGATATEYALLVTFIAIIIVAGVTLFGNALSAFFGRLATRLGGWA